MARHLVLKSALLSAELHKFCCSVLRVVLERSVFGMSCCGEVLSTPDQFLPDLPPEPPLRKQIVHLLSLKMTICKGVLEWQKDHN